MNSFTGTGTVTDCLQQIPYYHDFQPISHSPWLRKQLLPEEEEYRRMLGVVETYKERIGLNWTTELKGDPDLEHFLQRFSYLQGRYSTTVAINKSS